MRPERVIRKFLSNGGKDDRKIMGFELTTFVTPGGGCSTHYATTTPRWLGRHLCSLDRVPQLCGLCVVFEVPKIDTLSKQLGYQLITCATNLISCRFWKLMFFHFLSKFLERKAWKAMKRSKTYLHWATRLRVSLASLARALTRAH